MMGENLKKKKIYICIIKIKLKREKKHHIQIGINTISKTIVKENLPPEKKKSMNMMIKQLIMFQENHGGGLGV